MIEWRRPLTGCVVFVNELSFNEVCVVSRRRNPKRWIATLFSLAS